ncbi:AmmeMemoRadiSam system radical SAM enzyme [Geomonas sp. RF6]|uniref:AmmeMemoRadiSam system radical SAM enzyme n=1 Tax=Geomonas sp. RF6 TaxID=2897342 RepID=UPI001E5ABB5E|nr:AmmeMemoRadiSam system radical SAM enzyme [Geomonas sp. RF6]UFS70553.1 AmmeMemoRadiSam system radical SAM enzyme [Geomonas sp. RF6]
MKEAMFYEKLEESKVRCGLCRFRCLITSGQRGHCRVRENRDGTLYSLVYRRAVAEQVDPIQKKPLFHLLPGTTSYSVSTVGCNFRCLHCQNYGIAQPYPPDVEGSGHDLSPEEIVKRAVDAGCRSIAYTYTEPTIFYEYAYDTAVLAKEAGLKNVFVTNGYIEEEPLKRIAPYLDAANIDLKGFTERFYRETVQASLDEVLECIRHYKKLGIWIELTTLVIPGRNDDDEQLQGIARFIADELGPSTPWHVTRFSPRYKMSDLPPTPTESLRAAVSTGVYAGLHYVYQGNVPGEGGGNTYCPGCGALLIRRYGYLVEKNLLSTGCCPSCDSRIEGVWDGASES